MHPKEGRSTTKIPVKKPSAKQKKAEPNSPAIDTEELAESPAYNAGESAMNVGRKGKGKDAVDRSQPPDASPADKVDGSAGPNPLADANRVDPQRTGPTTQFGSEFEHLDDSLLNVVNSGWQGLDLVQLIAGNYGDDLFFQKILETPKAFRNFEIDNGLIYLKDSDHRVLCIPKIAYRDHNLREIIISEAHSLLAHLGLKKTLDYLRDHFWWKEIVEDTRSYCESCSTCKHSKPSNQKPYGLLHLLNPPSEPWDSVGVDFVGPLPESKNRDGVFNSLAVVIDLLTGMVHLIPARINYTTRQMAELMFEHIYKLHGLPKSIVSDRDSLFTSVFWKQLHELIGVKLRMSSAYHPETDGRTERANHTVTHSSYTQDNTLYGGPCPRV
jgi:hypothetical protein